MKACTVEKVEVDDEKIVLTVSGRCSLSLPDPDREKGGGKSVETLMDHCVITMNRKDLRLHLRLEGDKWPEYQKVARALAGKTARMQLRAVVTLDHGRVDAMRCTSVLFGEAGTGLRSSTRQVTWEGGLLSLRDPGDAERKIGSKHGKILW